MKKALQSAIMLLLAFALSASASAAPCAAGQRWLFGGKEREHAGGRNSYDYGARNLTPLGSWSSADPLATDFSSLSPFSYCGGDPINRVDPDGMDWYQNNQTLYYTWYDGDGDIEGFTHIGGKGSVLGEEFENIINNILCGEDGMDLESLYSNGFTFDIAPNDKGGLIGSKERGWDFFDEFVYGNGPEFSVLLKEHPYTKAIMQDKFITEYQEEIKSRGENANYTNVKRKEFRPWHASLLSPMQFIGTYRYDGYSSKDGKFIYNVATDIKNITSLFLHIKYPRPHTRSQKKTLGNTYQFYIWKSAK